MKTLAGLMVGKYHGIARRSTVVDVRAMDATGTGSAVHILSALDYIAGIIFMKLVEL